MSAQPHLAEVIPLRRPLIPDVDAPFRRYRDAGLVNERFAIDGSKPFWGYHNPNERWNGWATPRFIREVAELIVDWVSDGEPDTAWWVDDVLHIRGDDGDLVDQINADALGLYRFEGWTWLERDDRSNR